MIHTIDHKINRVKIWKGKKRMKPEIFLVALVSLLVLPV